MGETKDICVIKFNTFKFSDIIEYILAKSNIISMFLNNDKDFVQELDSLFDNFYNFCMNHNEFSRMNESIMQTVLECFSCVLIIIKHKKVYVHF